MSGREKILVVASAVALFWGVLILSTSKQSGNEGFSKKGDDVSAFIAQITDAVSPGPEGQREMRLIETARGTWGGSPFLDTGTLNYEASDIPLRYHGFVRSSGRVYALINNREYSLGEVIQDTGVLVKSIGPDQVVLIEHGRKKRILPLEKGL
jgi:hypothetical protein